MRTPFGVVELDQHDRIGRFGLEARCLAAVNDGPGEHLARSGHADPCELARAAIGAAQPRRPMMTGRNRRSA